MGDGFYRSKDPTNSIKVLKEQIVHRQIKHTIQEHKTQGCVDYIIHTTPSQVLRDRDRLNALLHLVMVSDHTDMTTRTRPTFSKLLRKILGKFLILG